MDDNPMEFNAIDVKINIISWNVKQINKVWNVV
jgi:hypothetical protein